jgi:hypothetical protein
MATPGFIPRRINGAWREGFALDLHTVSSEPIGYDEYGHLRFNTIRTEVGELHYQLKFKGDGAAVAPLVDALDGYLKAWKPPIDLIIPVPPSTKRATPPVMLLGEALSKRTGVPLADCIMRARDIPQLKNVTDLDERAKLLEGLHSVDKTATQGKVVLLFDDLYRSGATNECYRRRTPLPWSCRRLVRSHSHVHTEQPMIKVFIGGSRQVSRLNAQLRGRIDNIISKGFSILIGDANGADKAVQAYLRSVQYENVEVFCTEGVCRNNVGGWRVRSVPADTRERNAQFYSAKDRVMAHEADVGLMLWDGNSIGTLLNAMRLIDMDKRVVIYVVPDGNFKEFRNKDEWQRFFAGCDAEVRRKAEQRAASEMRSASAASQATLPIH